jgi:hypothetical protein
MKKEPVEKTRDQMASHEAYQKWLEGAVLSYMRGRKLLLDDYPAGYIYGPAEAPQIVLAPSLVDRESIAGNRAEALSGAISKFGDDDLIGKALAAVEDSTELAEVANSVGIEEDDIPLLIVLTAAAVAQAAKKEECGADCPYDWFHYGDCTRPKGHKGKHKCGSGHRYGS